MEALCRSLLPLEKKVLGAEKEETLYCQNHLIQALTAQNKQAEVEEQCRRLLPLQIKVLGAENTDTLATRIRLAYALRHQDKWAAAEAEYRLLLPLQLKVLGTENKEVVDTRGGLALSLSHQEKLAEAEAEYREFLRLCERVLRPDDWGMLNIYELEDFIRILNKKDKQALAVEWSRRLTDLHTKLRGPEDSFTLYQRDFGVRTLMDAGKLTEAEAECRLLLPIYARVFGPESQDALDERMILSKILHQQKRYAEAEKECRQVLDISSRVYGASDKFTLGHVMLLIIWLEKVELAADEAKLRLVDRNKDLAALLRQYLPAFITAYGRDHGKVLNLQTTLITTLMQLGQFAEAEKECREVLALSEHAPGAESADTLETCHRLALCLVRQKKEKEALPYAQRAYTGRLKVLGRDHEDTRESNNLLHQLTKPETKA